MAIIFENQARRELNAGQVVMLQTNAAAGSVFQLDNWGGFIEFKSIFTGVSFMEQTNHQMQQTFGGLHLNVFGDKPGLIRLSGLAFNDNCGIRQAGNLPGRKIGISYVVDYFRRMKLSSQASPLRVTIDPDTVYEMFLHTFQGDMFGEAHTQSRLYQFSLIGILIPPLRLSRVLQAF